MKKYSVPVSLARGVSVMVISAAAASAIFSALILRGLLPQGSMYPGALLITLLACLLGGMWASAGSARMKLPVALLSGAVYVLLCLILRGLLFDGAGEGGYLVILPAMIGAVLGALVGMNKTGKRRR